LTHAEREQLVKEERSLKFPDEARLGWVDWREQEEASPDPLTSPFVDGSTWQTQATPPGRSWKRAGPAQGTVVLPAEAEVRLRVCRDSSPRFSALAALAVDDIDFLDLGSRYVLDEHIPLVTKLTRLRGLELGGSGVTRKCLGDLSGLHQLEFLAFLPRSTELGLEALPADDSLSTLQTLENLTNLRLRTKELTGNGLGYLSRLPLQSLELLGVDSFVEHGWMTLENLSTLRRLVLYGSPRSIHEEGLKHVAKLTGLEELVLSTGSYAGTLRPLSSLKELVYLDLSYSGMPESELAHLVHLPKLERVDLSDRVISDEGLMHLAAIPPLRELSLASYNPGAIPKITANGFRYLSEACDLEWLDLNGASKAVNGIRYLGALTALRALRIAGSGLNDDNSRFLKKLTHLQELDLGESSISDLALAYVEGLEDLRKLALFGVRLTGTGLHYLQGLDHLASISIGGGEATPNPDSLRFLGECTSLRHVYLQGRWITDNAVRHLNGLVHLDQLDLAFSSITDDGLANLGNFAKLHSLSLHGAPITSSGLPHLGRLTSLEHLSLSHTGIDDIGLRELGALKGLESLDLSGTDVTDEGIANLRQALPLCHILTPHP